MFISFEFFGSEECVNVCATISYLNLKKLFFFNTMFVVGVFLLASQSQKRNHVIFVVVWNCVYEFDYAFGMASYCRIKTNSDKFKCPFRTIG